VLIVFRNVLGPTVNEFLRCALHFHPAAQPFVFGPERDCSFLYASDATLLGAAHHFIVQVGPWP
jgi:hypothetical protein